MSYAVDGYLQMDAVINRRAAAENARIANENARIADQLAEQVIALKRELAAAKGRIAELETEFKYEKADAEANKAVIEAFKKEHTDSSLFNVIGKYEDGTVRRESNRIWRIAYDAALKRMGIAVE